MTDKPETVADVLAEMESDAEKSASLYDYAENAYADNLRYWKSRIERALAASAVSYRWLVGDEAFHSEAEAIEAIRQWGPSDAIATPVYANAPPPASVPDGWRNVLQLARQGLGAGGAWGTPGSRQRELEVEIGGRLLDHIEDGLELLSAQPTTPEESP